MSRVTDLKGNLIKALYKSLCLSIRCWVPWGRCDMSDAISVKRCLEISGSKLWPVFTNWWEVPVLANKSLSTSMVHKEVVVLMVKTSGHLEQASTTRKYNFVCREIYVKKNRGHQCHSCWVQLLIRACYVCVSRCVSVRLLWADQFQLQLVIRLYLRRANPVLFVSS